MSIWHTPEREQLRKTVRMSPNARCCRTSTSGSEVASCPRAAPQGRRRGLLGAGLPESVGGGGGDGADSLIICEEMHYAGSPGGVFASLFTCSIAVPHMVASGDQRLIDTYVQPTLSGEKIGSLAITEPGGGSDVGHLTQEPSERRRLHHQRCEDLHHLRRARRLRGNRGAYRRGRRRRGVADRRRQGHTGVRGDPQLDKMGWRSSDTAELSVPDVRVPQPT